MKKPISYLYREILLKVDEELKNYYSDEYEEDERVKEAIDIFRLGLEEAKLYDVENFDEDKCEELYKATSYESWIGDQGLVSDMKSEVRCSGTPINDKIEDGRYYSMQDVAAPITGLDNICLAWTYYFGGGKWGEPEQVEWMDDCYLVTEKDEVRVVKVYKRVEE